MRHGILLREIFLLGGMSAPAVSPPRGQLPLRVVKRFPRPILVTLIANILADLRGYERLIGNYAVAFDQQWPLDLL